MVLKALAALFMPELGQSQNDRTFSMVYEIPMEKQP
jgi:hypothetical protein